MTAAIGAVASGRAGETSQIETSFHRMYELRFDGAREEALAYRRAHPDDPLGAPAEAASDLFEEFPRPGVLTFEFYLDHDRLLGGVQGKPDPARREALLAATQRAWTMALGRVGTKRDDPDGPFVLTLADGMQGDFEVLIEKRQLPGLALIPRAEWMIGGSGPEPCGRA